MLIWNYIFNSQRQIKTDLDSYHNGSLQLGNNRISIATRITLNFLEIQVENEK